MPLNPSQHEWLRGVITGLTTLSDNRWMMPTDHLTMILMELASVVEREVTGAVVEMGCAGGRTTLKMAALLRILGEGEGRPIHAYDSFQGFPPLSPEDLPGDLEGSDSNFRYTDMLELFSQWGDSLPPPVVHYGFFNENDVNHPSQIAFSLIDCDVGESVRTALKIIWPRLAPGGTVIIHDYANPRWPGVEKACNEWFSEHWSEIGERKRYVTLMTVTKMIP